MNTRSQNKPSCVEYWSIPDERQKFIEYSKRVKRDLFSTIRFFKRPPSQFPVSTAIQIYKEFKATRVFDPFCGWGDRCLASMACDIDYIGIDSNVRLKEPYTNLVNRFDSESKVDIHFMSAQDYDIDNETFDLVFTSPPFYFKNGKLTEEYNLCMTDYKVFMKTVLIPVVKRCLNKGVWVCLYIPKNMYEELKIIFGEAQREVRFNTPGHRENIIYCWKKL